MFENCTLEAVSFRKLVFPYSTFFMLDWNLSSEVYFKKLILGINEFTTAQRKLSKYEDICNEKIMEKK